MVGVFGTVDGDFAYWCCGDLKFFGTIAVAPKFRGSGSVDASGAMNGFFSSCDFRLCALFLSSFAAQLEEGSIHANSVIAIEYLGSFYHIIPCPLSPRSPLV